MAVKHINTGLSPDSGRPDKDVGEYLSITFSKMHFQLLMHIKHSICTVVPL